MIKIDKGPAPVALERAKARYNIINNGLYLGNTRGYNTGKKTFSFTAAYRSSAVKAALTARQHGKCCFCEAKFVNDDAHVEHFRPKGMVESWPKRQASYPGYYWLAYEWENLFLCKSTTNSSVKLNYFPLSGKIRRNRNHQDTRLEAPILIDPSKEDPRAFIRFKKEEIVGLNARGKKNIELLGLRNPQLDEARRTLYRKLSDARDAADLLIADGHPLNHPVVHSLIISLRESILPSAEFSSMAIDLLRGWPHLR